MGFVELRIKADNIINQLRRLLKDKDHASALEIINNNIKLFEELKLGAVNHTQQGFAEKRISAFEALKKMINDQTPPIPQINEAPEIGLLKHFGYIVGHSGLSGIKRREILDYVYDLKSLPKTSFPESYLGQWGSARSAKRLNKMAQSIASFCRSARSRNAAEMSCATQEWEEDLAYLKNEYYAGHSDEFIWPSRF
jgi:hypothetical protein